MTEKKNFFRDSHPQIEWRFSAYYKYNKTARSLEITFPKISISKWAISYAECRWPDGLFREISNICLNFLRNECKFNIPWVLCSADFCFFLLKQCALCIYYTMHYCVRKINSKFLEIENFSSLDFEPEWKKLNIRASNDRANWKGLTACKTFNYNNFLLIVSRDVNFARTSFCGFSETHLWPMHLLSFQCFFFSLYIYILEFRLIILAYF